MKVLIYINATGNEIVDKQVEQLLVDYCKARGYEVFAVYGEDTDRSGMSEPTVFMTVGMAVTGCIDRVVTLFGEMVGDGREDILTKLHKLDMFNIPIETVMDDLDVYYEEIYSLETQDEENYGLDEFVQRIQEFFNSEE